MIDGMTIWLPDDTGRAWHDKAIDEVQFKPTDDHTFIGHWGNFAISETKHGVTVTGSVAKFVNGQNTGYCMPDKYIGGLDSLGEELHIDLHNGIVRAAEFCITLSTSHPTHEYLELLGDVKGGRLIPTRTGNPLGTVTYNTPKGGVKFMAYDKAKESVKRKEPMPDNYKGCNLLRLELRISGQRKVREWLGAGKDLSPYDLLHDDVYSRFGELFLSKYNDIEKVGREVLIGKSKYTARDVYKLGALIAMQYCADRYNAFIASLQATGQLSKDNAKRVRRELRAVAADTETVGNSTLIDELDRTRDIVQNDIAFVYNYHKKDCL